MAKQKQTVKLKEPVRIRFKQLSNGNQSIYLDYYTGDVIRKENYVGGKRKYEFLKLYLIPERTREDKAKNEATLALAKAIQSKRIVEVQNDAHGFQNTNKSRVNLLDYLENIGKQSAEQGSRNYARTVLNTVRALKLFRGDYIAFRDVDKEFLSEFTDYLRQMPKASKYGVLKAGGRLSNNSVVSYYGTLRTAINRAYKEGIITVNPTKEFDFASKVRQEPSRREYLTIDELKTLINTECRHEIVKRAFLFSCLCGLRVSDIRKLRWCDLQRSGERVRIEITMQKTKEPLYLPISDEALKWLPERGEANDSDFIFPLTHEGTVNDTLQHWAKVAGITKHISFHVARHTHATMMLTLGADLYTVSKLLGHKNIATTQIYAKIVDKKKEEAIGLIPNLMEY
ncbi:site-specific integrase [uncultured Alistipes sp.]|uniref:site-specific integrase n=2 Tax=uncultured Alistipes sp. TaxID=538949 RepID=UPI00260B3A29|nr:site-specific integrase [uncultured Alistipes sp.]